jgi:hypothetical protein
VWFEKWRVVCFVVFCGWVSRSSAVVFEKKSLCFFGIRCVE